MTHGIYALVLDDHRLFADSFSLVLERYKLVDFVKAFDNKEKFLSSLESFGNGRIYIFLDYYLNGENGFSLLSEIHRLNRDAKIIFVTSALSPTVINTLNKFGSDGILSKSCSIEILTRCMDTIKNGEKFIDPILEDILGNVNSLTINFSPRELELLQLFAKGSTIAQTAEKTFLSPHTVVAHRRKMMAKVNCQSITQLLNFAKENGLI